MVVCPDLLVWETDILRHLEDVLEHVELELVKILVH